MKLISGRRVWLLGISLMLAACSTVAPTTLTEIQRRQVRTLTMECFRRNEGLATLYGSREVVAACKEKARAFVRPKGFG